MMWHYYLTASRSEVAQRKPVSYRGCEFHNHYDVMNLCVSREYAVLAAKAIAMAVLSEKLHSQYFQHQDSTAKGRYPEKLQILGNIEYPYVCSGVSETNVEWYDWLNVEFRDIYSYLIAALAFVRKRSSRLTRAWMDISM